MKAYSWEREKFSAERHIFIKPELRVSLTKEIARRMGIPHVYVLLKLRGNSAGKAWAHNSIIHLPLPKYQCCLGTIIHEVAHVYNRQKFGGDGHTGTWREALISCYVVYRSSAEAIMNHVNQAFEQQQAQLKEAAERQMQIALRKQEAKAYRQTPEHKMVNLKMREKRLLTKLKRTLTLLKSVRRKQKYLERQAIQRSKVSEVPIANTTGVIS